MHETKITTQRIDNYLRVQTNYKRWNTGKELLMYASVKASFKI